MSLTSGNQWLVGKKLWGFFQQHQKIQREAARGRREQQGPDGRRRAAVAASNATAAVVPL